MTETSTKSATSVGKIDILSGVRPSDDLSKTLSSDSAELSTHGEKNGSGIVRTNLRAVAWCIYAIWVMVASAYTNTASGSILGIPRFRKDFGRAFDGNFVLPAQWQSAYYGSSGVASAIGAILAAWTADKFGRRPALALVFGVKFVSITLELVATTNQLFFGGFFLCSVTTGAFGTLAMTYIAEISPQPLRGILTAAAPVSMTAGSLVAAIVINCTGDQDSRWAYRTAFVSEYGFAVGAAAFIPFMPESPWWLIARNKDKEAHHSFKKLGYDDAQTDQLATIFKRTLEKTNEETLSATYLECFRKSNLRRTIICVAPLAIHALSGVSFVASYSTYYQQLAGYTTKASFHLFIVQQILSMAGNICSWFLIDRVGRRSLSFWGMVTLTTTLLITGGLAVSATPGAIKGTVALLLLYCFVFNFTIGATAYTIATECSTSRLRAKSASMAFAFQSVLYTVFGIVLPYLFNPDKANLGAKVAFIFGALSVLSTIYIWAYQPEFAGLSYEKIDELFIKRVPARRFKKAAHSVAV